MLLTSNEFWGRRSGTITKEGAKTFRALQWGAGSSGNRHPFRTELKNVPRKWFGVNYKSKRNADLLQKKKGQK